MADPAVCCVMLTRDRPEMAARAVRCFRKQTYVPRTLVVYDTGTQCEGMFDGDEGDIPETPHSPKGYLLWIPDDPLGRSIGALRNAANAVIREAGVIIHWDDDDISHPNRIAEQLALLQSSGAECVGYREMLFWREQDQQAWLYTHGNREYALGTSLCYWRSAWEANPFRDTSRGEDLDFIKAVKTVGVSSLVIESGNDSEGIEHSDVYPRMIATIHAGNARQYGDVGKPHAKEFRRVPEWDDAVRRMVEES